MEKPWAIFIMGPTASGKTDLAIELARRLPVELISVDSALVYRGMDIGTAKPDAQTLKAFPHHLVDICEPTEAYSAARFCTDALAAMQAIRAKGKIPLLVGGTMLYFHALQHGLSDLPHADAQVRQALQQRLAIHGIEYLHEELKRVDPDIAHRIHAHDTQRILRALEVFMQTGQPMSRLQAAGRRRAFPYRVVKLARAPRERKILHQRIAQRFEQMLAQGFEDEVRNLLARPGIRHDLPSMRAVGYRQMVEYLHGRTSYRQMCEKGIIATRQLAKRQLTWLRREDGLHWISDDEPIIRRALDIIQENMR